MKTILVLEDEPCVMTIMRLVLSKRYNVLESTSAEDAFQHFRKYDGHIDLLIADVVLPVSSGIRVALELRSLIPDLRIILTSGYPPEMWRDQDRAELDELPSDSVSTLEKPFFPTSILQMVEALIGPPELAAKV